MRKLFSSTLFYRCIEIILVVITHGVKYILQMRLDKVATIVLTDTYYLQCSLCTAFSIASRRFS